MKSRSIVNQNGQVLIEALIGIALFTVGIGVSSLLISGGGSVFSDYAHNSKARLLAKEGVGVGKRILDSSWDSVPDGSYGLSVSSGIWAFSGTSDIHGDLTRQTSITTINTSERRITSKVLWQAGSGSSLSVEFSTIATNWKVEKETGGDTGGGPLSGNWQNPQTLGSVDLGPGISATGLDVKDKIVYVSGEASTASKPDFFIIDATNGASPLIVSSLNTGNGLNAVDAAGSYAYLANSSTTGQLQIIDISNKTSPVLRKTVAMSGASGSGAVGWSLKYLNQRIYIGLKKSNGPEFFIYNVADPLNPAYLGSFELNEDLNAIVTDGTTAYLGVGENPELIILNVANPANIFQIGSFNPAGSSEIRSLYLLPPKLYFGREFSGDPEFYILDVSISSSPISLGSYNVSGGVIDIAVRNDFAFLGTDDSNAEFQIWKVANSASSSLWSFFNFPQVSTGIDYENNAVYMSVRSNDAIRIITSQ